MNDKILLESQGLSISIGNKTILKNISFSLRSGQCIAVLGQSGAGKSTLLKILAGQLNSDSGQVIFRGVPLIDPREQLIRGHKEIKLVNQDFDLELFLNVEENLRIKLPGYVKDVRDALIDEILDVVELKNQAKQQVRYLSGGEQQRLALARELIQEPDVLLLDEPFVHLDAGLRVKIEAFIMRKIKAWNSAVILVTHDGREAMTWADEIIYLNEGQVMRQDSPQNFYENPRNKKEALHFGPINQIKVNRTVKYFRPNAYQIVDDSGILLTLNHKKFFGTHHENWMLDEQNNQILLYSQHELPTQIRIKPHYVGEE